MPLPSADPAFIPLMVSGLTASISLEQVGQMTSGETVLVTGMAPSAFCATRKPGNVCVTRACMQLLLGLRVSLPSSWPSKPATMSSVPAAPMPRYTHHHARQCGGLLCEFAHPSPCLHALYSQGDFLRSIGCDRVVNYKKEDLRTVLKTEYPKGVDLVYVT